MSASVERESWGRRPVGYAEVPDFHVEVARLAHPEHAEAPLIIGGDPAKRGKVLAFGLELRSRGIVEGMSASEALERAPEARWIRTDMARARELSGRLRAAIRRVIDAVEVDGLAGFYLEAPDEVSEARELAARLEAQVRESTGLPLRLGVAPARFAARLAAEDAGRSGAVVVDRAHFEDFLLGQPVARLPGVGPKTAARLAELGAADVPGLRALGAERLEVLLGNHGRALWLLACGEDPKPLRVRRHPKTLSREETFDSPKDDLQSLGTSLGRLAESLEAALRRDGLQAGRIALRLTYADAQTVTRSRSLGGAVDEARLFASAAMALLEKTEAPERPVRRAGLVLAGLELSGAEDRQLDLF